MGAGRSDLDGRYVLADGARCEPIKTKAMMCTPGFIWEMVGGMAYKIQATGEGATFRERKKESLSCATCGVTVAASYLKSHMARSHCI